MSIQIKKEKYLNKPTFFPTCPLCTLRRPGRPAADLRVCRLLRSSASACIHPLGRATLYPSVGSLSSYSRPPATAPRAPWLATTRASWPDAPHAMLARSRVPLGLPRLARRRPCENSPAPLRPWSALSPRRWWSLTRA
jgi:hypothetical protein